MFKKSLLFISILSFAFMQNDILELQKSVSYKFSLDRNEYFVHENVYLNIDLEIKDGFHIYSVHPDKSLSPTFIEITDSLAFSEVGVMLEPSPKKKCDKSFNQYIFYHTEKINLIQPLKISKNINLGENKIQGILNYLACDKTMCIPISVPFEFTLNVHGGNARIDFSNKLKTEYDFLDYEYCDESTGTIENEINKGLFSFIIFSIGMGLLALLTPCVFPMIPITVSYFTKEGEKENNSPVISATIYALGIIIIFTSLGLLLTAPSVLQLLGVSGVGDLAANPWVNLFIGFLFIFFAFNLFGFYEIQVPSFLTQYSLNKESKGGKLGIIFMSLTFTLTSFTCTVAFVGALLAIATTGAYFWPIIGMLSFSTAFAFPFFFLALFPQYLSKLPKSGGWLNSIKVVMGFLELAAAFKFLSNTDLVNNWGVFTRDSVLSIWSFIFILIGFYILGKIRMPLDSKLEKISNKRIVISFLSFMFGVYLWLGLSQFKISGLIESYLPPPITSSQEEKWIENMDEAYLQAQKNNMPIFIDFTGYTCTNCRWMELNIFELPEVKELFDNFILVKLYTDGGEEIHKKNREFEINRFNQVALPFYVILSPNDKLISTFPGMDTNKDNFINFLKDSIEKYTNEDF